MIVSAQPGGQPGQALLCSIDGNPWPAMARDDADAAARVFVAGDTFS
jgi:hypothetical protein